MADDIVVRLRSLRLDKGHDEIVAEAADTIEWLRDTIDRMALQVARVVMRENEAVLRALANDEPLNGKRLVDVHYNPQEIHDGPPGPSHVPPKG